MVSFIVKAEALITGEEAVTSEDDLKKKWKSIYEDALVSDSFKLASGDVQICGNCEAIIAKLQSLVSVDFKAGVLPAPSVHDHSLATEQPEHSVETRSPTLAQTPSKVGSSKHDASSKSKSNASNLHESAAHKKTKKGEKSKKPKEDRGPSMDMLAKFAAERDRQQQLLAEQERQMGMGSSAEEMIPNPTKSKDKMTRKDGKKGAKEREKPPVNSLEENEKRLLELEQMATNNAARFMQPEKKLVAPGSAISLSEESFLLRQSAQGDVSQYSSLREGDPDNNGSGVNTNAGVLGQNLDHERDKKVIPCN
jgi:hypothetical protein